MMATPTLTDCFERNVHHFICGKFGKNPECGHSAEYKECKNCKKVVWLKCITCSFLSAEQRRKALWREDEIYKPKPVPITIKAQAQRRKKEQNQK